MLPVFAGISGAGGFSARLSGPVASFALAGALRSEAGYDQLNISREWVALSVPVSGGGAFFSCSSVGDENHPFAFANLARIAPHPSLPYMPAMATV